MSDYESEGDDGSDYDDPDLLDSTSVPISNKKYNFDDDEDDKTDDDIHEPLYKRLANLQKKSDERAFGSTTSSAAKKRKLNHHESDKSLKLVGSTKESKSETEMKKRTKHMPATMRSNKPVSRYIRNIYIYLN